MFSNKGNQDKNAIYMDKLRVNAKILMYVMHMVMLVKYCM